jgi:hypothetical protein
MRPGQQVDSRWNEESAASGGADPHPCLPSAASSNPGMDLEKHAQKWWHLPAA